jgi:hypothetical protein
MLFLVSARPASSGALEYKGSQLTGSYDMACTATDFCGIKISRPKVDAGIGAGSDRFEANSIHWPLAADHRPRVANHT